MEKRTWKEFRTMIIEEMRKYDILRGVVIANTVLNSEQKEELLDFIDKLYFGEED